MGRRGAIAVGSVIGAQVGARVGRKLPPLVYRVVIVAVGVVAIINPVALSQRSEVRFRLSAPAEQDLARTGSAGRPAPSPG